MEERDPINQEVALNLGHDFETPTDRALGTYQSTNSFLRKRGPNYPIKYGLATGEKGMDSVSVEEGENHGYTKNRFYLNLIASYESQILDTGLLRTYTIVYYVFAAIAGILALTFVLLGTVHPDFYSVAVYDEFYKWNSAIGDFERNETHFSCTNVILAFGIMYVFIGVALLVKAALLHRGQGRVEKFRDSFKEYLLPNFQASSSAEGAQKYASIPYESSSAQGTANDFYFRPFTKDQFESKFWWQSLRDSGVNLIRFIDHSVSTGMFIWLVVVIIGVSNVMLQLLLWILVAAFFFTVLMYEVQFNIGSAIEFFMSQSGVSDYLSKKEIVDQYRASASLPTTLLIPAVSKPDFLKNGTEPDLARAQRVHDITILTSLAAYKYLLDYQSELKRPRVVGTVAFFAAFFLLLILVIPTVYLSVTANSHDSTLPWIIWLTYFAAFPLFLGISLFTLLRPISTWLKVNVLHYEFIIFIFDFTMKTIVAICVSITLHGTPEGIGLCATRY